MNLNLIIEKKSLISFLTLFPLVVITTGIILYFMPRKSEVKYEYSEGKPWMSDMLIAEFDFDITRSAEDLENEKQKILQNYQPYFKRENAVEEETINNFLKAVEKDTTGILKSNKEDLVRNLHKIYEKGIIGKSVKEKWLADSVYNIKIINDNKEVTTDSLSAIPDVKEAYSILFSNDEQAKNKKKIEDFDLVRYVRPNIIYPEEYNENQKQLLLDEIPIKIGEVKKNQKIIGRGEIVNSTTCDIIRSYQEKQNENKASVNKRTMTSLWVAQSLYILIFVLLFTIYLSIFRPEYLKKKRKMLLLYIMIALFPSFASALIKHPTISVFIIPFALVPMITRVFFDTRTAFMTHVTIILISAIAVNFQYGFIIVEMAAGMAAIYTLGDMSKRAHLFVAALLATLCAFLVYYSMLVIQTHDLTPNNPRIFYHIGISGVQLLLAYPLMFLIEKIFGFVSQVTYFELSDTNQPLLRSLSEKAPGTFAHSNMVSNLAAEIAQRIGANALLVRTGALYHDIGKMENPGYFTENQLGFNPHTRLTEKQSAQVIINHVKKGLQEAEKHGIPDIIKDFIPTHHGKGITSYFYIKYKNAHPDEDVSLEPFSYPGPNPQTKEQAILMMADAVEAATKSLDEYSDSTISKLVNDIIDKQINQGFFKECPITFRDIAIAKQVLINRLKSNYHSRIKYPELISLPENGDKEKEDQES